MSYESEGGSFLFFFPISHGDHTRPALTRNICCCFFANAGSGDGDKDRFHGRFLSFYKGFKLLKWIYYGSGEKGSTRDLIGLHGTYATLI